VYEMGCAASNVSEPRLAVKFTSCAPKPEAINGIRIAAVQSELASRCLTKLSDVDGSDTIGKVKQDFIKVIECDSGIRESLGLDSVNKDEWPERIHFLKRWFRLVTDVLKEEEEYYKEERKDVADSEKVSEMWIREHCVYLVVEIRPPSTGFTARRMTPMNPQ